MKPPKAWEYGLKARCWHCNKNFTKTDYCLQCGFYKCPYCGKCACQLSKETREAVNKTFEALAPILTKNAENRVGLHGNKH